MFVENAHYLRVPFSANILKYKCPYKAVMEGLAHAMCCATFNEHKNGMRGSSHGRSLEEGRK